MKVVFLSIAFLFFVNHTFNQPPIPTIKWEFFSTEEEDFEVPNGSEQQTSTAVFDIDKDGINDFIITERVKTPSVVWYKKNGEKWDRYNPDAKLRILLGDGKGNFTDYIINEGYSHHESKIADLDGDGDYGILSKPYAFRAPGIDIWLQNGTNK